ncbi:hypothetical protein DFQ14_105226 [Halopolyspora algeriensis]|uniref:Uncharacterized protein n=1 Tax=Halopolyspora algeriensis TaxID=1500506 RepID=A0A368VQD6_9ACTN|nr:oxidoreductase [Halopolyspora algeriensis]RCW44081.1 hypothetical protein DFQ14_105226 [Halopolyspora algeriensis]TQM53420.1 hypothetical protein FHU43_2820 [Halopolyspora algeriensis]
MGLFDRLRRRRRTGGAKPARSEDTEYLRAWAAQRRGVEGFVEPPTAMTQTTLVLVAHDGEWTRRRVSSADAAHRFTNKLGIPFYEVTKTGYPQRMRDYQARQRALRKRQYRRSLGE